VAFHGAVQKANTLTVSSNAASSFDLFRLTKSKSIVDVCSNTLRGYHAQGLPFYKRGRAIFVSKAEVEQFIRNPATFGGKGR
jgi:hypothetical protein